MKKKIEGTRSLSARKLLVIGSSIAGGSLMERILDWVYFKAYFFMFNECFETKMIFSKYAMVMVQE